MFVPSCALVAQFLTYLYLFLLKLVCWLHIDLEVLIFGWLFLVDVQSLQIELWGVSGPEVNIIVHSQTQLKTRAEGFTLQTYLAWLIIWTTLQDGDGDSPKGIRRKPMCLMLFGLKKYDIQYSFCPDSIRFMVYIRRKRGAVSIAQMLYLRLMRVG